MDSLSDNYGPRDNNFLMVRIIAKRTTGLNICHLNAQSLNNKLDEFRYLFENSSLDVICISETWFHPDRNDNIYKHNGYRLFRADRHTNGGGVAIYLRNGIYGRTVLNSEPGESTEHLFLELRINNEKLLMGCVYRPNHFVNIDPLITKLETISVLYNDVIIADAMAGMNLRLVNDSIPTHFATTYNTLLDPFFVSHGHKILHYDQLDGSTFSRHDFIFLSYDITINRQAETYTYRDFRRLNISDLELDVNRIDWNQIYYLSSVESKVNFLTDNIVDLYNLHVPMVTKNIKTDLKPWFTSEVKTLIDIRERAYKRWKRYKTPELYSTFQSARKDVVRKVKHEKLIFYTNKFNNATSTKKTSFPTLWKLAKIIPVPKGANEFRPIAILPFISKVFERLVNLQILQYLTEHKIITDRQSGFRPRHSCLTALVDVVESIRNNLDKNEVSILVLLDHSKAFDTVHYPTLYYKLIHLFSFSESTVRLMSSYLEDRKQLTVSGNNASSQMTTKRGVPQGSILGPLLDTMYSNDLPNQLEHTNIRMYVDDVQLYTSTTTDAIDRCIMNVNNDLNKILDWANGNGLALNPNKSKAILIHKKSTSLGNVNIFLGNCQIELVKKVKNLGVTFNENLTWSDHINANCGKIYVVFILQARTIHMKGYVRLN
ncbi:uncharacterized protein LOC142232235 [Haematobia irritans]|uniref:uncharacterized protein LOC142232235 n=1 Tax=Haematobia irritans TaxID=7368 RepID=UPI003F4F812B